MNLLLSRTCFPRPRHIDIVIAVEFMLVASRGPGQRYLNIGHNVAFGFGSEASAIEEYESDPMSGLDLRVERLIMNHIRLMNNLLPRHSLVNVSTTVRLVNNAPSQDRNLELGGVQITQCNGVRVDSFEISGNVARMIAYRQRRMSIIFRIMIKN